MADGLLDFLSSPAGMGLLSAAAGGMAGARRGAPWNTAGAALLGGVSGYTSAQAAQIDQAKKKNELGLMNQAIREMTGQGANPAAGVQAPGSGGAGMSAPAQSATWYGAAPSAQPSAQSAPKYNGMSLRTLQLMGLAGMKNLDPLFNMYKYQNDGIERKPGTIYRNPTTGAEEYIPNVEKGYNFDPRTKAVTALPGFIDTNNAIKGGEADATEKAKSRNTLLPLGYTRGGVPVGGSVGDYLGGQQGTPRINPQSAPQKGVPTKGTPENWNAINQKYAAGAGQRQSDQLTILQQERAKATNPNDIAMLDREIARFGGQRVASQANSGQLDSEADKAAAVAKVEEDKQLAIARRKDTEESFAKLQDMQSMMPRLEVVTKELSDLGKKATYTKAGQGRDAIYRQLGLDVGEGAIARREYISKVDNEILPLLRQTFGAQFTQKEGESLKATLGDTDASPEEKDAVLRSFIETKYGQIAGLKRRTGQQGVDSGTKPATNQSTASTSKVMDRGVSKSGKPIVKVNGQWHYATGASADW